MNSQEQPSTDDAAPPEQPPPVADVKPLGPIASGRILQSRLWWLTLMCLGLAVYLAWHSHRPTGIEVTVEFPEGHGLKTGDSLRHRGIDIGTVTDVELADDLHGVQATVEVSKSAKGIAVEGSQFWIVRPQLSLTNISGLETAVGSKYIAISPGPTGGATTREFIGLKDPPTMPLDADGIKISLLGNESFGINPGSPVTYRGIVVGRISSVDLGPNAKRVYVSAEVDSKYKELLRKGSKFWKTSGVDFDFGIRGFHLSTESLATVAKGGVSFVTPKTRYPEDMEPIKPGHPYELHGKLKDSWMDNAAEIPLKPSLNKESAAQ